MNKTSDNTVFADNVALVQSHDSNCLAPIRITTQEFYEFTGDVNETFELMVADSKIITESEESLIRGLFGSWSNSGTEDADLEELYKSRLNTSLISDE